MPIRISIFGIILLLFFNLSYGNEVIVSENSEIIEPPLFGIVIKGDNLIINPNLDDIFAKKNLSSFLKPQTLAIITSIHKNLPYVYLETDTVKGWFNQDFIQILTPSDFDKISNLEKILLTRSLKIENVTYPPATKLPLLSETKKSFKVLIATKEVFIEKEILKNYATRPLSPEFSNIKKLTKIFNKKPYVWANSESGWDCSGLIQDLFSFLNISLPRNSFDQINSVDAIDVTELSLKEREKILRQSKPYFTLLYFPGHIMIYTGKKGKDYFSFQALSKIDNKKYGYVGFFPLKKTGLLKKITKIGYISLNNGQGKKFSYLKYKKEDL